MAEITQLLDLASGNKELGAWIGMYRDEDNWQWSNGEQVAFYNWKRNLFFCTKVNEDGTWEDAVCNEGHPFVCYKDAANAAQRYTFVNLKKSWPQAQQHCRERNSDLATIHSLNERVQGSISWIGLFNEPWQWSDGGNSVFRQWKAGKPDNYNHNEDCVCIDNIQSDGDWDDYPCSTNLAFYCCSGNSSISISVRCEAVLEEMTWSTAQSYCRVQDKDLPTIYNAEEIQQLLEINCTDMCTRWIGMYKGKQNWLWTNGETLSYANWKTSQFCAVIDVTGYWMDVRCFESYSFICYTETSDVSQRYTLINVSKTWAAARDYCREKHTDLVTISNHIENDAVRERAGGSVIWIGLFNEPWKWSDGSNSVFRYWPVNQPNNYNGDDKCVHVYVNNADKGMMNDYTCSVKFPFICYEDAANAAQRYTFVNLKKSWPQAQQHCRERNSDLATIHSLNERVQGSISWIGLFNEPWQWSDGGNSVFRQWKAGKPDNYNHNEDCVCIDNIQSDGDWDDYPCSTNLAFYCCSETSDVSQRYTLINLSKTWAAARDYCREKHTDLVTISNHIENDAVRERAGGSVIWIGLFNEPWKWSDGSNSVFRYWPVNQPNNYNGDDKCVHVYVNNADKGMMNDYTCSVKFPFICYEGLYAVTQCHIKTYHYVATPMNWTKAQSYCRQKYTDLVTVFNQTDQDQLLSLIQQSAWMGMYRDQPNWQWSIREEVTFYNWKKNWFCAKFNDEGTWEDVVCHQTHFFMCYTNNDTQRYTLIRENRNWTEARDYCREQHTDLVTIQSLRENEAAKERGQGSVFWIGLFNEPWKWSNGRESLFRNWAPERPSNVNRSQACVIMEPALGNMWSDASCSITTGFICCDKTSNTSQKNTLVKESKNWAAAQDYCREKHTDLVTIQNDSENKTVRKRAGGGTVWIGLFNEPWKWSDGGTSSFRNWNKYEPNNFLGNEKCAGMYKDGKWNDFSCSGYMMPFICEEETPLNNIEHCFSYCTELILCHCVRRPPFSIDLYSPEEATQVTEYLVNSYFRHYSLYKYTFTPQVRLDLSLSYTGMVDPDATDSASQMAAPKADGARETEAERERGMDTDAERQTEQPLGTSAHSE
ncbi:MRC1 protein, partial [Amia calva]|nr:MRC1 protein [Amia calva]